MNIKKFIKECSRREVFKLLSIYVVSSWILLQVLALIAKPIGLPDKSISALILILIIGFPIYIIYIWKSRLSKSWASDEDDSSLELLNKSKFRQMYFTSIGIILFLSGLAATIIFNNTFSAEDFKLPKIASNDKIAVLKFDNLTSIDSLNDIGKMAAYWISHGITENDAGHIISQDLVKDYSDAMKTQNKALTSSEILSKFFNPGKRVIGTYFKDGNELIFKSSIVDGVNGKVIMAFEQVVCDQKKPLNCIKDLQQDIVGYLVDNKKGDLSLEINPPNYIAFKTLIEAKASKLDGNVEKYLELLNKSIALDSQYFEPKSLKIAYYYNNYLYETADSLLKNITQKTGISKRQQNINNLYRAALDGDNRKVYLFNKYEYNIIPDDVGTNFSQMIGALQFVNKPEDVESVFKSGTFDELGIENCSQCVDRIWAMAYAFNELGDYDKTINLLEPYINIIEDRFFILPLLRAYVFLGQKEKADQVIQNYELRGMDSYDWLYLNLFTAQQFTLQGKKEESLQYFNTIINNKLSSDYELLKAEAYLGKEDYKNAEALFLKLSNNNPNHFKVQMGLAISYFKNGNITASDAIIKKFEALRGPYQYGAIDYRLAQIYAARNDEDKVFECLLKSIAAGNRYNDEKFKNSSSFADYLNSEKWNSILTYWH